jgi:flagellar biosynthesis/type III secretory pathway protein FliH
MSTRPFLFDRDLEDEEEVPSGKAGRLPPPTLEEAVEAALRKARTGFEKTLKQAGDTAYERGLADGRAKGIEEGRNLERQEGETEIRTTLAAMAERLQALQDDLATCRQTLETEAGAFVAHLVAKLLPGLEAKLSGVRLERFIRDALATARNSPVVVVRMPPAGDETTEETLRRLIAEIGHAGTVEIKTDATLEPGALSVSWGAGGVSLDPARAAREIVAICARELGVAPEPVPTDAKPLQAMSSTEATLEENNP